MKEVVFPSKVETLSLEEWLDTIPADSELKLLRAEDRGESYCQVTALFCPAINQTFVVKVDDEQQ